MPVRTSPEWLRERQYQMRLGGAAAQTSKETAKAETSAAFEQHYKVAELAKLWKLSYGAVLNRAKDMPGVIRIGKLTSRKRTHVTISIPRSVAEQLHAELTQNEALRLPDQVYLESAPHRARNASR